MDFYNRQHLKAPETISLIGCGGGCWVAIFGAMMGVKRINLFDSDILEGHNLNRLPYSPEMVGKKKTLALKQLIQTLRPDCEVSCFDKVEKMNIGMLEGKVFIAVDNLDDRQDIDEYCKERNLERIHMTFEKDSLYLSNILPKEFENAISIRRGYNEPTTQVVTTASIVGALALASMSGQDIKVHLNDGGEIII